MFAEIIRLIDCLSRYSCSSWQVVCAPHAMQYLFIASILTQASAWPSFCCHALPPPWTTPFCRSPLDARPSRMSVFVCVHVICVQQQLGQGAAAVQDQDHGVEGRGRHERKHAICVDSAEDLEYHGAHCLVEGEIEEAVGISNCAASCVVLSILVLGRDRDSRMDSQQRGTLEWLHDWTFFVGFDKLDVHNWSFGCKFRPPLQKLEN